MARHLAAPQNGSVLITAVRTTSGSLVVATYDDDPATPATPGVISGWVANCTEGFTATIRDKDVNGNILLVLHAADGARIEAYPDPEHWRGFSDGVYVVIAGTGDVQIEYRPD